MKKLLSIGLVGLCALTLVGCGNNETDSSANASIEVASEKVENEEPMQTYYGKMFGQTTDIFTSAMSKLKEENFIEAAKIASTVSEVKKDFNSNKSNLKEDQKKQDKLINLAETLESMGAALAVLDFESATKHSVTFSENMFTISNDYFNGEFSKETQLYLDTFK